MYPPINIGYQAFWSYSYQGALKNSPELERKILKFNFVKFEGKISTLQTHKINKSNNDKPIILSN